MKRNTFYFISVILIFIIGSLFYIGIFEEIKIQEKEVGPFKVVYETHIGDYSEIGEIKDRIYNSLLYQGINTTQSFGIYYDNPKEVDKDKLRSEIGVILEKEDYDKIENLKSDYNFRDMSKINSIVTTFPFRHKFSITLGIFKVYPKLNKYLELKEYKLAPVMEIYDSANNKIIYIIEIVK